MVSSTSSSGVVVSDSFQPSATSSYSSSSIDENQIVEETLVNIGTHFNNPASESTSSSFNPATKLRPLSQLPWHKLPPSSTVNSNTTSSNSNTTAKTNINTNNNNNNNNKMSRMSNSNSNNNTTNGNPSQRQSSLTSWLSKSQPTTNNDNSTAADETTTPTAANDINETTKPVSLNESRPKRSPTKSAPKEPPRRANSTGPTKPAAQPVAQPVTAQPVVRSPSPTKPAENSATASPKAVATSSRAPTPVTGDAPPYEDEDFVRLPGQKAPKVFRQTQLSFNNAAAKTKPESSSTPSNAVATTAATSATGDQQQQQQPRYEYNFAGASGNTGTGGGHSKRVPIADDFILIQNGTSTNLPDLCAVPEVKDINKDRKTQWRLMNVREMTEMFTAIEFFKTFGADLMKYENAEELHIAKFEEAVCSTAGSFEYLSPLYTSFLGFFYGDSRTITPANLQSNLAQLITMFYPSFETLTRDDFEAYRVSLTDEKSENTEPPSALITASVETMTDELRIAYMHLAFLEFPDIPPFVHVKLLSWLVELVVESVGFKEYMDQLEEDMSEMRKRKWRRQEEKRSVETEITQLDADIRELSNKLGIVDDEEVDKASGRVSPFKMSTDASNQLSSAIRESLSNGDSGANAEGTAVTTQESDIGDGDVSMSESDMSGSTSNRKSAAVTSRQQLLALKKVQAAVDMEREKELKKVEKQRNKLILDLEKKQKSVDKLDADEAADKIVYDAMVYKKRGGDKWYIGTDRFGRVYWWWDFGKGPVGANSHNTEESSNETSVQSRASDNSQQPRSNDQNVEMVDVNDPNNKLPKMFGVLIESAETVYDYFEIKPDGSEVRLATAPVRRPAPAKTEDGKLLFEPMPKTRCEIRTQLVYYYVDSKARLDKLYRAMNDRGIRERDLRQKLLARCHAYGVNIGGRDWNVERNQQFDTAFKFFADWMSVRENVTSMEKVESATSGIYVAHPSYIETMQTRLKEVVQSLVEKKKGESGNVNVDDLGIESLRGDVNAIRGVVEPVLLKLNLIEQPSTKEVAPEVSVPASVETSQPADASITTPTDPADTTTAPTTPSKPPTSAATVTLASCHTLSSVIVYLESILAKFEVKEKRSPPKKVAKKQAVEEEVTEKKVMRQARQQRASRKPRASASSKKVSRSDRLSRRNARRTTGQDDDEDAAMDEDDDVTEDVASEGHDDEDEYSVDNDEVDIVEEEEDELEEEEEPVVTKKRGTRRSREALDQDETDRANVKGKRRATSRRSATSAKDDLDAMDTTDVSGQSRSSRTSARTGRSSRR